MTSPVDAALLCLLEPHTLAEVAKHIGQSLSATRLLLGHLVNEGRILPDGSGGYTLHPRERPRQESRRKALDEAEVRRRGPKQEVHVRTENLSGPMAPRYLDIYDEKGEHGDDA